MTMTIWGAPDRAARTFSGTLLAGLVLGACLAAGLAHPGPVRAEEEEEAPRAEETTAAPEAEEEEARELLTPPPLPGIDPDIDPADLKARVESGEIAILEEIMTADEIYLELVRKPELEKPLPVPPKRQFGVPPYTLPTDPLSLPLTPATRVREMVPAHLVPHFDLYLYVNKAVSGLWAQQMYVYEKVEDETLPDGYDFRLDKRLLASTGREKFERYHTTTPTGLFRLDRTRFFPSAISYQWNGTAMPWAMFFDYNYTTRKSGYAIHAAIPDYNRNLGQRASAGCVRLYLNYAEDLFKRVQANHKGQVPEFTFDEEAGTTNRKGEMLLQEDGTPVMKSGYRVLVVIDDTVLRPEPADLEGAAADMESNDAT